MIIAAASLCTSMCYGMQEDDCFNFDDIIQYKNNKGVIIAYNKNTGETASWDDERDAFIEILPAINPVKPLEVIYLPKSTEKQNATNNSKKLPIPKLPKPRSLKTGYGLAFLPQHSFLKYNLKSLCKDPQNIQYFKTIARFLEDVNHLNNINRERSSENEHNLTNSNKERPLYDEKSPLAGIKRVTTLLRSKKIEHNVDKSYQDALDSANKLTSKLPRLQREQILKDLDKAIENAQHSRFQAKLYS